jgi:undecaprenyl-diphosphatase
MDIIQAIILGIVQGATEFLPISSSAHLVLIPWILGWDKPSLTFDLMTHYGTLLAVVIYYRNDLWGIIKGVLQGLREGKPVGNPHAKLGWLIVLSTIPAVLLGYFFEEPLEALFGAPLFVAIELLITGAILWFSETLGKRTRSLENMSWWDSFWIGIGQAIAISPGISRSGATIATGLVLGFDRASAARFSFLMSIPVIFGAGLLKLSDFAETGISSETLTLFLTGGVTAGIVGYIAIAYLIRYLATHSLRVFAIYCWIFGGACIVLNFAR